MSSNKSYIDSTIRGTNWHSSMPSNPKSGDCYYDDRVGCSYAFDGKMWIVLSSANARTHIAPAEEDLEKHPALKQAWEEYMVIKKLIGI